MYNRITGLATVFIFIFLTFECFARITINIHNETGDSRAFLYLNTPAGSVKGLSGSDQDFNAQIYKQPFLNGNNEYQISFDSIDSGNLNFGLLGPESEASDAFRNNKSISTTSDAYTGFIEFSYLPPGNGDKGKVYWDLSNVDQLGMLCGLKSNDPGLIKAGYNKDGNSFTKALLDKLAEEEVDVKSIAVNCGPDLKYIKLLGPTIRPEAYSEMYNRYLDNLTAGEVNVTLWSDALPVAGSSYRSWKDNDWQSSEFTGHFSPPADVNVGDVLIKDVILQLTNDLYNTRIYLTKSALSGKSIVSGDSDGGMYVTCNDEIINDSSVSPALNSANVHLNWVGNSPAETYRFQAWVDSVTRELLVALNCGRIAVTPGAYYSQKDEYTWVPEKDRVYENPYNQYIVANSNSYGMSYSDGAGGKVQYLTGPDVVVDLYLLGPDNQDTSKYYDSSDQSYNGPTQYEVAFGFGSTVDKVEIDGKTVIQDSNSSLIYWIPNDISRGKWIDMTVYKTDKTMLTCKLYFPDDAQQPSIKDAQGITGAVWNEVPDNPVTKWVLQTAPI